MTQRRIHILRLAICTVMVHLASLSASGVDVLLRHSNAEPGIKEMGAAVAGKPADSSLAVAEDIIGKWKAMPVVSKALARNPDVTWESIYFQPNGVVEISYEMKSEGKVRQFVGSYEIVHKATVGRGNPPNIVIRSRDAQDESLNVLANVRIGEFSYFPPDSPVLWFQDPDGYHYVFEPVGASVEHRGKLLRRSPSEREAALHGEAEDRPGRKRRIADAEVTRQAVAKLQSGGLTEYERNSEILRLMNEGDATCVPVLIEHLKAEHPLVVRQNAIRALGKVGDKRAVAPLLDILRAPVQGKIEDEGEDEAILRRKAVVALGDIGDPAALPALKGVAESAHDYQSVRDLARSSARKLEEKEK